MLNVVIGLFFVFLVFSLIVSAVNEALTALFAVRSKILWQTLAGLAATTDKPIAKLTLGRVLQLPFTAPWLEKVPLLGRFARRWLDHRPPVTETAPAQLHDFVQGVLTRTERFDSAGPGSPTRVKNVESQVVAQVLLEQGGPLPPMTNDADPLAQQGQAFLDKVLKAVKGTQLEAPVRAAVVQARGDIDIFRRAIEGWFDARMAALSRLYKTWTRWILFGIALIVALVLNLNPIRTVEALRDDSALAQATVAEADALVSKFDPSGDVCAPETTTATAAGSPTTTVDPATRIGNCYVALQRAVAKGRDLPPPLKFDHFFWDGDPWWEYALGAVIGAIAISFGAPFWFDALKRVMALRS